MSLFRHRPPFAPAVLVALLSCSGCKPQDSAVKTPAQASPGCLPGGDGFLRAQLHGAHELRLDWGNAEISCEGGLRPDASGIRISIAGPIDSTTAAGERLRFVFGISTAKPNQDGRALPTNLTAILENEHRIYATLGDDKCTVDELRQKPLPEIDARSYRVEARGFCIAPATVVGGEERLLVSTFDFAGRIQVDAAAPLP